MHLQSLGGLNALSLCHRARGRVGFIVVATGLVFATAVGYAQEQTDQGLSLPPPSLWKAGVGSGFKAGTQDAGVSLGAGFGIDAMGTTKHHHWVLGLLHYGWIFTDVVGQGHWYQGNWEVAAEIFGGEQFYPDWAYLAGGGPHFRYYFATGHRWVPFIDVGAGGTATDIRNGDLSTTFEFNLQFGGGTQVFLSDSLALTLEYRFIHLSNAGIDYPNNGVNNNTFLVGLTWFF